MTLPYHYTPYIWPMLASAAFMAALGAYAWRRRSVPGARPLAMAMLFMVLWAVGAALELAAVDVPTKIVWIKFQAVWQLPSTTRLGLPEQGGLGRGTRATHGLCENASGTSTG